MTLIDGKAISEQVKQEIAAEVAEIVARGGIRFAGEGQAGSFQGSQGGKGKVKRQPSSHVDRRIRSFIKRRTITWQCFYNY